MPLLIDCRNEIIICLSEIVRDDVLREGDMRVEKECRQQLNVEVLRRVSETSLTLKAPPIICSRR